MRMGAFLAPMGTAAGSDPQGTHGRQVTMI